MIEESMGELKERIRSKPEYIAEKYFADIITQLSAYMENNEITQTELADKMDVSSSQISQFFNDNKNVTLKTLAKIAKALGVSWKIKLDTVPEGTRPRGVHYDWRFFPGHSETTVRAQSPTSEDTTASDDQPYTVPPFGSGGNNTVKSGQEQRE